MADAGDIELLQFPYSHFNEKARWALDFKGLAHRRRSLMPGPHMGEMKRLTGQTKTPALHVGDTYVTGSAAIIDWLERNVPEPALYPADPDQRARALELQARFDSDVGPQVRIGALSALLQSQGYMAAMFGEGQSAPKRFVYRCLFPFAAGKIRQGNGITGPESIERAIEVSRAALDLVAAETAATGYLVGDGFSVADLAAASLLAVCADPPNSTMSRPKPIPPAFQAWLDRWADHPGTAWVLEMYRRHRNAAATRAIAA
ncbi:MAG: glutathione S-transferase [Alphaproteobacteria bacterium]